VGRGKSTKARWTAAPPVEIARVEQIELQRPVGREKRLGGKAKGDQRDGPSYDCGAAIPSYRARRQGDARNLKEEGEIPPEGRIR